MTLVAAFAAALLPLTIEHPSRQLLGAIWIGLGLVALAGAALAVWPSQRNRLTPKNCKDLSLESYRQAGQFKKG
ncbi:MAG: hypothetical protein HY054_10250 [Proteobacteria bacterium]|nr:hypothetical protein [Pseudomonadota bacterium]